MNTNKVKNHPFSSNLPARAFAVLLALGTFLPGRVWAYDGVTVGQIAFIEGIDENGFAFQLVGSPPLCSNGSAWGAVKTGYGASLDKIKLMLALLLSAKLSGAQVRVYAWNNPWECTVAAIDSPL
jgi:hypothetical protein